MARRVSSAKVKSAQANRMKNMHNHEALLTRIRNRINQYDHEAPDLKKQKSFMNIRKLLKLVRAQKLPEQIQAELIRECCAILLPGKQLKDLQVEAILQLGVRRKDLVFIARTSYGKSMPILLTSLLYGGLAVNIVPLNSIAEDQVEKLKRIPTANPVILNHEANSMKLLKEIKQGQYTHVFIGPETALKVLLPLTIDEKFTKLITQVSIDEAHLVHFWGKEFRPEYSRLIVLRDRLSRKTPWYACSATLAGSALGSLYHMTGIPRECRHIRISIDRPNISIALAEIPPRSVSSLKVLYFIIKEALVSEGRPSSGDKAGPSSDGGPGSILHRSFSAKRIKKTIIYIDNRNFGNTAKRTIREWLKELGVRSRDTKRIVRQYDRQTPDVDRQQIWQDLNDGVARIVIATESLGTGVDLDQIERVIQYGIPITSVIDTIWQRFGRAGRPNNSPASGIFLFESWAKGPEKPRIRTFISQVHKPSRLREQSDLSDGTDESDGSDAEAVNGVDAEELDDTDMVPATQISSLDDTCASLGPNQNSKRRRTAADRRGELDQDVREWINCDGCKRTYLLKYFGNDRCDAMTIESPPDKEHCCSSCNPDLLKFAIADIAAKPPSDKRSFTGRAKCLFLGLQDSILEKIKERFDATFMPSINELIDSELLRRICVEVYSEVSLGIIPYKMTFAHLKDIVPDWDGLQSNDAEYLIGLINAWIWAVGEYPRDTATLPLETPSQINEFISSQQLEHAEQEGRRRLEESYDQYLPDGELSRMQDLGVQISDINDVLQDPSLHASEKRELLERLKASATPASSQAAPASTVQTLTSSQSFTFIHVDDATARSGSYCKLPTPTSSFSSSVVGESSAAGGSTAKTRRKGLKRKLYEDQVAPMLLGVDRGLSPVSIGSQGRRDDRRVLQELDQNEVSLPSKRTRTTRRKG